MSRTDINGLEALRLALHNFEEASAEANRPPRDTEATDALEKALRDCLNRYGRPADNRVRHVAEALETLLWVYHFRLVEVGGSDAV